MRESDLRFRRAGERPAVTSRIGVQKTYKLYIGGEFVRSESGRSEPAGSAAGSKQTSRSRRGGARPAASVSRASRKDLRDAVRKARDAFPGWSGRSAYSRGQILYRMAEMLEARAGEFIGRRMGDPRSRTAEVAASVDRLVYYAGWSDKIASVLGTVNPVASSHFDFSIPEPTGVVGIVCPERPSLAGLVALAAPALVAGNCAVALLSQTDPIPSLEFAEILATSDLPAGAVNLLSGRKEELLPHLARHMEVDAIVNGDIRPSIRQMIEQDAEVNVKRVRHFGWAPADYLSERPNGLAPIEATVEIKTTWHPIGA
jgi:acyl-CoA reductase-like NAD-dependent aldehyde dehydrogenase